jgi:hypothetical protein
LKRNVSHDDRQRFGPDGGDFNGDAIDREEKVEDKSCGKYEERKGERKKIEKYVACCVWIEIVDNVPSYADRVSCYDTTHGNNLKRKSAPADPPKMME